MSENNIKVRFKSLQQIIGEAGEGVKVITDAQGKITEIYKSGWAGD